MAGQFIHRQRVGTFAADFTDGTIFRDAVKECVLEPTGILKEGLECYFQFRLAALLPESQTAFL